MAMDMMNFCVFCSCFTLTISLSFLNVEELSSTQYGVEITNKPVLLTDTPEKEVLHVASKHGQTYSCYLPDIISSAQDDSHKEDLETNGVVNFLDLSFNGTCLTHNKGWWSYKVCYKKNVEQYHIAESGKIEGAVTLLGLYESEDDWSKKENLKSGNRNLYHTQKYVNGSICDLTNMSRKTTIQYYCSDQQLDSIIRVEEPSTCEYVFTVHSSKLCTHPLFKVKEKTKHVNLVCSPALKEKQFNKYLAKIEKQKGEEGEEAKRKQKEKETPEKSTKDSEGENVELKPKLIWQDAAQEANKFLNTFMKTLDIDSKDIVSMNFYDTGNADETFEAITEEDTMKDPAVEDTLKLETKNEDLIEQAGNIRKELTSEYSKMRESALKELDRSKNLLITIKNLHKLAKTEKEKNEAEVMMVSLEENIESFHKQIKRIEKHIAEVEKFKELTTKRLIDIDKQLKAESQLKSQALNKIVKKNVDSKEKEKTIMDTVTNMVQKFNIAKKEDSKNIDNNKFDNKKENLNDKDKEINDEIIVKNSADTIDGKPEITESDSEFVDGEQKSFEDTMKYFADFMAAPAEDDGAKLKKLHHKTNPTADEAADDGSEDMEKKNVKINSLDNLVSVLKKQINYLNKKNKQQKTIEDHESMDEEEINDKRNGVQVRIRTLDDANLAEELEKDMDKIDEKIHEDIKAATKQMEEAVKKQLKEAGLDFKNDIKIKIITTKDNFDKFTDAKTGKLLNDNEANEFKDLLLGFLGGGKEKVDEEKRSKALENHYNFVWDKDDDGDNEKEIPTED